MDNKLIDMEIIKSDLLFPISKKYNISYESLLQDLANITMLRTVNSKFTCNHNFFANDNELSFYWAGFIAADGCVYRRNINKQLIIALAEKDLDHLKMFKKHINFDGNINRSVRDHSKQNPNWNKSIIYTLNISSSQIFEDLKRFNIVPQKTLIYTFPYWLKHHKLVNHFMRGYIDGDGSFYYQKNRNRVCFELRGTLDFLKDCQDVLENNILIKSKVHVTTPDSTSKIKYNGKKIVPQIVDFIYKNSTIYLPRKYEIAQKSKILLERE